MLQQLLDEKSTANILLALTGATGPAHAAIGVDDSSASVDSAGSTDNSSHNGSSSGSDNGESFIHWSI